MRCMPSNTKSSRISTDKGISKNNNKLRICMKMTSKPRRTSRNGSDRSSLPMINKFTMNFWKIDTRGHSINIPTPQGWTIDKIIKIRISTRMNLVLNRISTKSIIITIKVTQEPDITKEMIIKCNSAIILKYWLLSLADHTELK